MALLLSLFVALFLIHTTNTYSDDHTHTHTQVLRTMTFSPLLRVFQGLSPALSTGEVHRGYKSFWET